jgi:hypothetical protein
LTDDYRSHYIIHTLVILATGLMIVAVVSLCIGVILDNVTANNHFQYGLRLIDWPSGLDVRRSHEEDLAHYPQASEYVARASQNREHGIGSVPLLSLLPSGLSSYIDRVLIRIRYGMFEKCVTRFEPISRDTVLDVGVSACDHIS